ncbi:hypothetical protein N9A79_00320 [Pirellulales bacterium]|nr:hypothetical protein [Pirellulales bacterium]
MLDEKTKHYETTMLDLEAEGKEFEPSTHCWISDAEYLISSLSAGSS